MKNIKGFTLIELIVVLGLSGIVISVIMSFFIANYKSYQTINTESEVQYQSQYIINYITNVILEANKYDSSSDRFVFVNDETAKFEVVGNRIKHTSYNSDGVVKSANEIGNHVASMEFSGSTNEVTITLKLSRGNAGDTYSAEQVVYLRNSANN